MRTSNLRPTRKNWKTFCLRLAQTCFSGTAISPSTKLHPWNVLQLVIYILRTLYAASVYSNGIYLSLCIHSVPLMLIVIEKAGLLSVEQLLHLRLMMLTEVGYKTIGDRLLNQQIKDWWTNALAIFKRQGSSHANTGFRRITGIWSDVNIHLTWTISSKQAPFYCKIKAFLNFIHFIIFFTYIKCFISS